MSETAVECSVEFPGPASPGYTLSPLRRGGGDPCYVTAADGAIWRTSLMRTGPATARISRSPAEPTIAEAHRRVPHLRLGRTGRVLESLIPAVIEQRVAGKDAFRAWRLLVTKFGSPAPGPAPARMHVPPAGDVWRRIPSWEFHLANVDPGRARTVVGCAQRADSLERLVTRTADQAREALTSLPGVGVWTAAETAQRAMGDADALSVGDYHLAKVVGWTLLGRPIDDDASAPAPGGATPRGQRPGPQPAVRGTPSHPGPARDLTQVINPCVSRVGLLTTQNQRSF